MLPRRFSQARAGLTLAGIALFVLLCFHLYDSTIVFTYATVDVEDHRRPHPQPNADNAKCPAEFEYLRSMRLTDQIRFSKRCIRPVVSADVDRDKVVNVSQPLFVTKQTIDLSTCAGASVERCEPVSIAVPRPYPERKYPEYIFGVATTQDRLRDSARHFSHWLSGSSSKLVAVLTDKSPATREQLDDLRRIYTSRDMHLTIINPTDKSQTTSQRHFTIIRDLVRLATSETKWLGVLDDDTFFPSLHLLSEELDRYDHAKDQYVGALSEDFRAVRNWGFMAFGGAGVFLSLPTARALDAHMEECLADTESGEGDGILRDCVYRHTHAKLRHVPELHQQDMRGDVSGFFEAGFNPISLHHWKSWYRHPVDKMAIINRFCGDCFLQRWRFGEDTVLTNGYSVAVYPGGHAGVDLAKTEETWGKTDGAFDHSLGPMRAKMAAGEKMSYVLVEAEVVSPGKVRQVYVMKGNSRKRESDEVIELLWDFT